MFSVKILSPWLILKDILRVSLLPIEGIRSLLDCRSGLGAIETIEFYYVNNGQIWFGLSPACLSDKSASSFTQSGMGQRGWYHM